MGLGLGTKSLLLRHEAVIVFLIDVESELVPGPAESLSNSAEVVEEDGALYLGFFNVIDLLCCDNKVAFLRPVVHVDLLNLV